MGIAALQLRCVAGRQTAGWRGARCDYLTALRRTRQQARGEIGESGPLGGLRRVFLFITVTTGITTFYR